MVVCSSCGAKPCQDLKTWRIIQGFDKPICPVCTLMGDTFLVAP